MSLPIAFEDEERKTELAAASVATVRTSRDVILAKNNYV